MRVKQTEYLVETVDEGGDWWPDGAREFRRKKPIHSLADRFDLIQDTTFSAAGGTMDRMAATKKRTSTAKPASRANGRSASNGVAPIRGKARREAIEALRERTSKPKGLSPEVKAALKDDAWGKRLVDP